MATFSPLSLNITDTSANITWTDLSTTFPSTTSYTLNINSISVSTSNGNDDNTVSFTSVNINAYLSGSGPGNYPVNVNDGSTYNVTAVNPIIITCFVKGTKILTLNNGIEEYIKIENLKIDNLIKTYKNGYKKLKNISYKTFKNDNTIFKICKISGLENQTEDLFLTGPKSLHDCDVSTSRDEHRTP